MTRGGPASTPELPDPGRDQRSDGDHHRERRPQQRGGAPGGNARRSGAHLHFQIMRSSTPERNWWTGAGVLNPYPVLMELIAPPVFEPTPITEEVTSDAGGDRY